MGNSLAAGRSKKAQPNIKVVCSKVAIPNVRLLVRSTMMVILVVDVVVVHW